jgi:NADPH:quinone reductase-like Zn-dependent oxidoreductase
MIYTHTCRDVWIRLGAYPGIQFNSILGADGVGVVASDTQDTRLTRGSRVVIYPAVGWEKDPRGPEGPFSILGLLPNPGTFAEYISVPSCDVFPAPAHLSDAEAAALPLASLTAYRAVFTKAQVKSGDRVLITGIGKYTLHILFLFINSD